VRASRGSFSASHGDTGDNDAIYPRARRLRAAARRARSRRGCRGHRGIRRGARDRLLPPCSRVRVPEDRIRDDSAAANDGVPRRCDNMHRNKRHITAYYGPLRRARDGLGEPLSLSLVRSLARDAETTNSISDRSDPGRAAVPHVARGTPSALTADASAAAVVLVVASPLFVYRSATINF